MIETKVDPMVKVYIPRPWPLFDKYFTIEEGTWLRPKKRKYPVMYHVNDIILDDQLNVYDLYVQEINVGQSTTKAVGVKELLALLGYDSRDAQIDFLKSQFERYKLSVYSEDDRVLTHKTIREGDVVYLDIELNKGENEELYKKLSYLYNLHDPYEVLKITPLDKDEIDSIVSQAPIVYNHDLVEIIFQSKVTGHELILGEYHGFFQYIYNGEDFLTFDTSTNKLDITKFGEV